MAGLTRLLSGAIVTSLCTLVYAQDKSDALRELERKGIPSNERAFARSIKSGSVAEVELFLKAGFDPNKPTSDGLPLGIACREPRRDVAELLIARGAGFGGQKGASLHAAASCGLENLTVKLLQQGADINAKAGGGLTPLLLAVHSGHLDVARTLLSNGADIEAADENGDTPLMTAAAGRSELVLLLLERGAKVNVKNKAGGTALHVSVQQPAFGQISQLLISRGADVTAKTNDGWTCLHIALIGRNEEMARFFLDQGLDVNAKTADDWTPLHLAAAAGYTSLVVDLIDRGAEINAKKSGWTPLSFAIDRNRPSTIAALVQRGATQ